jgi:hypothetical protein
LNNQIVIESTFKSLKNEQKIILKKFGLISSAIRGFWLLRKRFYEQNGIERMKIICSKFPELFPRFCWMIGTILDEECLEDNTFFVDGKVKEFLKENRLLINDDDIFQSTTDRL